MWFVETPWPPIFLCAAAAAWLVFRWSVTRRGGFLVGVLLLACLSLGIYVLERRIISEAERIEANVHALAQAVVDDERDRALDFFSPRAVELKQQIASALISYDIGDDLRITDLDVSLRAENSIGVSHFRANGTITGRASALGGRGATRWLLTWQNEGGKWKITNAQRLHPLRDDETMGLTAPPD